MSPGAQTNGEQITLPPVLIYIHGYNSSPQSIKAEMLRNYIHDHHLDIEFLAPEVSPLPDRAIESLCRLVEQKGAEHVRLVGSSMGGFYATYLAEKYGVHAVLINPAVKPQKLLLQYLGENTHPYSGETYVFDQSHIETLEQLDVDPHHYPDRYLLMVQTGDETLDYRLAVDKYQNCPSIIEEGGSHRFSGFENWIPYILEFLDLTEISDLTDSE